MIETGVDGLLALVLLLPSAIAGVRLARTREPARRSRIAITSGLIFTAGIVLALQGRKFALATLSVLSIFVILTMVRILYHGRGRRRFPIAFSLLLFTTLCYASYIESGAFPESSARMREAEALNDLRQVMAAEAVYMAIHGRTASLEDLQTVNLVHLQPGKAYKLFVRAAPLEMQISSQFYAVAVPMHYRRQETSTWLWLIPGASLMKNRLINGPAATPWATLSFMVDETCKIRSADLNGGTDIKRADARKWQEI